MIDRSWIRFPDSLSDNLKSKACPGPRSGIENPKWWGIFAIAFAFAFGGVEARAQQPEKVPRIGYLSAADPAGESTRSEGIRLALRELNYIEGQNVAFAYRYAKGKVDRLPDL